MKGSIPRSGRPWYRFRRSLVARRRRCADGCVKPRRIGNSGRKRSTLNKETSRPPDRNATSSVPATRLRPLGRKRRLSRLAHWRWRGRRSAVLRRMVQRRVKESSIGPSTVQRSHASRQHWFLPRCSRLPDFRDVAIPCTTLRRVVGWLGVRFPLGAPLPLVFRQTLRNRPRMRQLPLVPRPRASAMLQTLEATTL